jgi:SAM-dependent methyltransferase
LYEIKLADIYDSIYYFIDYSGNAIYIENVIEQYLEQSSKDTRLLEVACGTGKYLELLQKNYDVAGLDLSQDMLDRAAQRLSGVELHQASMADFSLNQSFDVVCCLFRSIAYLKTKDALVSAVKAMAAHLNPQGIIIIEPFFTPEKFWDKTVTLNNFQDEALKVSWMYSSKKIDDFCRLDIHYLVGADSQVQHFTETHDLGLFNQEDFALAFKEAGLDLTYDPIGPAGIGLYIGQKC